MNTMFMLSVLVSMRVIPESDVDENKDNNAKDNNA